MPPTSDNLKTFSILAVLAACTVLMIATIAEHSVTQFLILAGLVVSFLDRHFRFLSTQRMIDENTKITATTHAEVNGQVKELLRTTSQAAYAKGLLDGQFLELQRKHPSPNAAQQQAPPGPIPPSV
jgi:hypothetical protein